VASNGKRTLPLPPKTKRSPHPHPSPRTIPLPKNRQQIIGTGDEVDRPEVRVDVCAEVGGSIFPGVVVQANGQLLDDAVAGADGEGGFAAERAAVMHQ